MPVKRCSSCHLYIEGAPSPQLAHDGKFGPSCESRHHPDPCDYENRDQGPCNFFIKVSSAGSEDEHRQLSPDQLEARDKFRQEEMDRMSGELVAMKRRQEEMDNMAADMHQMKEMMKSMRAPPPSTSSLTDHDQTLNKNNSYVPTNPTTTLTSSTPSLTSNLAVGGLGNNLGQQGAAGGSGHNLGQQGAAGTGRLQDLHEAVSSHIQKNTVPPASVQSRGGYSGPTMTEIRKEDELDAIAKRVIAALETRIPQIKETFAPVTNHLPNPPIPPYPTSNTNVTASLNLRPLPSAFVQQPYLDTSHHPAYAALAQGAAATSGLQLGGGPGGGGGGEPHPSSGGNFQAGDDFLDAASIMQLCTVSNRKQVRPHEFAKLGRFSYASKITDKNITVPLFVMGYLQHVVALLRGIVPVQSETEVVDRLSNLMTIMEITSNNSSLDDFKCPGWSIGLEYAGRIFHDIEYGRIKWENLSEGLQPHTFLYAKDTVEMQLGKSARGGGGQAQRGGGRGRGQVNKGRFSSRSDRPDDNQDSTKVCQLYNGFFTGSGCAYEYNNQRKCNYEHYCSSCHSKTGKKESHKSCYCNEQEVKVTSSIKPAVTSG